MKEAKLKIAVVGHIDHGKSTLIGRLMYEAGGLSQDVREELQRSEFAYFTDHLEEERLEERTIDTAQAFFRSGDRQCVIIDTPGHKEFIKNMLTGASQADAAILIVSAFEGVGEQTRRHAYLLKLLGIEQVVVAVNKMDLIGYEAAVFNRTKRDILAFLDALHVPVSNIIPIPVSAKQGDNIISNSDNMKWFKGAAILGALDEFKPAVDALDLPLRLPVQGSFDGLCLGRLASGRVRPGEQVLIMPHGLAAEIAAIKTMGTNKREALAGESVGLLLEGGQQAGRGEVISSADDPPKAAGRITAHIFWLAAGPCSLGDRLTIKCATAEAGCVIEKIDQRIDTSTLEVIDGDADRLEEAEAADVVIALDRPMVFEDHGRVPELGRFVLQREGRVCAGGIVNAA